MAFEINFRDIISMNLNFLYFFGNLFPEFDSISTIVCYSIRASFFLGFFLGGIVVSEIVNFYFSLGDLEKLSTASFLTFSNVISMGKFFYIFKYKSRIISLAEKINRKEFQPKTNEQYLILKRYIKLSKLISVLMYGACVFTCTFWAIYPFTVKGGTFLPIAAWMPSITKSSPYFEIAFVYETVATVIGGLTDLSADCLIAGFIMVVCAQLNILNNSLKNIRQFAEKNMTIEIFNNSEYSEELEKIMNEKLIDCVLHHRYILEFGEELTFLFTKSLLGQFIVSAFVICTTLFEMSRVSVNSLKFVSLILYQFCMLMEIFIVCFFGNEVISESSKLTDFAYHCDWADCSTKFKRNLIFLMTRSQMILKFYAGGFFVLSLDTFVKILKSSWTYFAVLLQVNQIQT